jgi:hypothetical protein
MPSLSFCKQQHRQYSGLKQRCMHAPDLHEAVQCLCWLLVCLLSCLLFLYRSVVEHSMVLLEVRTETGLCVWFLCDWWRGA